MISPHGSPKVESIIEKAGTLLESKEFPLTGHFLSNASGMSEVTGALAHKRNKLTLEEGVLNALTIPVGKNSILLPGSPLCMFFYLSSLLTIPTTLLHSLPP